MRSEIEKSDSDSELEKLFDEVSTLIRETPVTPELEITNDEKLRMYGLYKHITVGSYNGNDGPSLFNVVARAKYQAWADCRDQTRAEAQLSYVEMAASYDHWLGRKCLDMLNQYRNGQTQREDASQAGEGNGTEKSSSTISEFVETNAEQKDPSATPAQNACDSRQNKVHSVEIDRFNSVAQPSLFATLLEKRLGVVPLIPRGQIDISYRDLAFAAFQCFWLGKASMRRYCQKEDEIAEWWELQSRQGAKPVGNGETVVVGLSVRSLLDLYLTSKSYPPQSEVIVVPPINVPGMMEILLFHKLKIVPVDIPEESTEDSEMIRVDLEAVKKVISEKTVAILIVHPFGTICTSANDMRALQELSRAKELDILEDCAQCYSGFGQGAYLGSPYADISLFSFGTIKTATALGGGVAVLRNETKGQAEQMKRVQHTLYQQQTAAEYLWKVIKGFVVKFVSEHPILYGLLLVLCQLFGLDFDGIVLSATRGFAAKGTNCPSTKGHKMTTRPLDGSRRRDLMVQLRKRPSTALLSLLHRRLCQYHVTNQNVRARIDRCRKMSQILESIAPGVLVQRSSSDSKQLYWLYPIKVEFPDAVSRILRKHGYDIPRGTSQLGCVSNYADTDSAAVCPNTESLFDRILYLPAASRSLSVSDMQRMARAVNSATSTVSLPEKSDGNGCNRGICDECGSFSYSDERRRPFDWRLSVSTCVVVIFDAWFFNGVFLRVMPLTLLCVTLVVAYLLRFCIADFYIESSKAFAKYNFMLYAKPAFSHSTKANPPFSSGATCNDAEPESMTYGSHSQSQGILNIDSLKLPQIQASTPADPKTPATAQPARENRAVFLTGATGFVGSLLLRDLLLHRESLSILGGVVVLCRPKGNKSAAVRVQELLDDQMFSFLTAEEKKALIFVVEGDVTLPNVGMTPGDVYFVCDKMNVSHVFHCAAAVSFTQSLEDAAISNISSSLNLQSLTKRLRNRRAKYVHISTAFVFGAETGSSSNPLAEELYSLHPYDPLELYQSMLETQSCAFAAMHQLGFPNTYTFSKCICEHLLVRQQDVNTVIVRPSIVGPAVQEPYEGWAGEKPSTIVAAACLYMSYQWNLWSFGKQHVPFIPVDVVSRFILVKAFGNDLSEREIPGVSAASSQLSSDDDDFERISRWSESSSCTSEPKIPVCTSPTNAHMYQEDKHWIYNAAWDTSSPQSTSFSWVDYAVAVTQLGSVKGYFNRATAYLGLAVTVKLLPRLNLSFETYQGLHRALVLLPIKLVLALFTAVRWNPYPIRRLRRLNAFLDLPMLFFPFMNNTFTFASGLVAPEDFNAERYMFSCAVAAENFLARVSSKMKKRTKGRPNKGTKKTVLPNLKQESDNELVNARSRFVVGGSRHNQPSFDLWWSLTQPRGNCFIRIAGWVLIKILRVIAAEVTVDVASFSHLARSTMPARFASQSGGPHVVLAPTHRSLFDFLLLSFVFFAMPELGVVLPHIAAADDFARLPILGWFARNASAFFLKRGRGSADPALNDEVRALKKRQGNDDVACIEVFIEGSRSRDRRFICPKTGFLRCLAETGGDHVILPITICYECIPDQTHLAYEAERGSRRGLSNQGLLSWLKHVLSGEVNIGSIHIAAAPPVEMESSKRHDFSTLAKEVQIAQQANVCVSSYHIKAASVVLGLKYKTIHKALSGLGCKFWPVVGECNACYMHKSFPELPNSPSELWTVMLQFGHCLAPLFVASHPKWCQWLNPVQPLSLLEVERYSDLYEVMNALAEHFDAADDAVDLAFRLLRSKGFAEPKEDHVVQFAQDMDATTPSLLVRAAVGMRLERSELSCKPDMTVDTFCPVKDAPFVRGPCQQEWKPSYRNTTDSNASGDKESLGLWGYKDSRFVLEISCDGSKSVVMKGNRYGVCGKRLTKLVPFIEKETQVRVDPLQTALPIAVALPQNIASDLESADVDALKRVVSLASVDVLDRARNGFGHSQEDVYLLRSGSFSQIRFPDAVVWPSSEEEVSQLVSLAITKDWCLIPCGGGTNVTHATRCPTKEIEPRPVISLDTKKMNRVLWVNEEDGLAHVESGITGSDLIQELEQRGYTIGHEPDSFEFSTLGGWIATKASGMKRNMYGNIEDIVKAVRVAGSEGMLWQNNGSEHSAFGRESRGIDLSSIMMGSEGCFGVITSAIVRIWPIAECHDYASVIFPDFEHGLRFVREVAFLGQNIPASVRLLDNDHFRLGQALREDASLLEKFQTEAMNLLARMTHSFSSDSMVCATITYEGDRAGVRLQQEAIKKLSSLHGGALAGSRTGRAGYDLTFVIAYLRDFAMSHFLLSESFETFAPWSKLKTIVTATKQRIRKEHKERCLPGVPFVGCRVTQLYHEGACLYFYFCINFECVKNPSTVFAEILHAARSEILENGGSLSHHHGVGKIRAPFLSRMDSKPLQKLRFSVKESIDPKNVFGARNGVCGDQGTD